MSKKKLVVKEMEYLEYADGLDEESAAWVKKFYNEYYAKGSYSQDDPLLTSESQLKEARRVNNSLYRDALSISLGTGRSTEVSDYTMSQKEVLEMSSNELEWEMAYKQAGQEYATELIFKQAERSIADGLVVSTVLARFYVKMEKLRKQVAHEKRKAR